jgi:hypothetical protein
MMWISCMLCIEFILMDINYIVIYRGLVMMLVVQCPKYDILLDQRLNWFHKCSFMAREWTCH